MHESPDYDRGKVNLVTVMMTFFVLVAIIALAPTIYKFIGMVSSVADPFTALLLQLAVPLLLLALILSVGKSAVGGR